MVVATSKEAYELGLMLCEDYERTRQKERDMNKRRAEAAQKKKEAKDGEGISRKVQDIDYEKHEETVKELDRQEKEEAFMRKRQEASLWCKLDHEHGPQCRQPVHGCSHDHQKEWAIYEKSTEEKIRGADRFRQEGNEAFKKQNYGLAAVHYRKALLQFDYTFAEGDVEEKQLEDVKLPCLLNLAACKCQQEEWDEVLTQCRLALELNPRSVKAYYRTGQAHIARDKFDLAKDALMTAYEIEPNNPEVRSMLRKLKTNMDNYQVRQKQVYTAMTSGTPEDADEEDSAQAAASSSVEQPSDEAPGAAEASAEAAPAPTNSPRREEEVEEEEEHDFAPANAIEGPSTARRRRGADEEKSSKVLKEEDDDIDEEDSAALASQKKMMNCIFIAAAALGVASLSVVGSLMYMGDT